MKKKSMIGPKDITAFLEAIKGTKPLSQEKHRLLPPKPKTPKSTLPEEPFNFHEDTTPGWVAGDAFIAYKQAAISNKTLRKLKKGQYNVDAMLDLHGMTVEEAKIAIDHFLHDCLHHNRRVVLIIHGKGHHSHSPVLKNKLNQWLRGLEIVLAFCSAAMLHGSRGATYILLKRQ